MKFNEVDLEGYEYGTPCVGLIDASEIDRDIAECDACPECGGEMRYEPRIAHNSYRAFAVCDVCDESVEF